MTIYLLQGTCNTSTISQAECLYGDQTASFNYSYTGSVAHVLILANYAYKVL